MSYSAYQSLLIEQARQAAYNRGETTFINPINGIQMSTGYSAPVSTGNTPPSGSGGGIAPFVPTETKTYSAPTGNTKDDLGNDLFNTRWIAGTPFPSDVSVLDENTMSYGVLQRCGVALLGNEPIQGNTPFQHQDRAPFSFFTTDITTLDNLLMLMMSLRAFKSDANFKVFVDWQREQMKQTAAVIASISAAGKTSYAANSNALTLAAGLAHRAGLIDDGGYIKTIDHIRSVFDKLYNKDILDKALETVTTFVEGSSSSTTFDKSGGVQYENEGLKALLGGMPK